MFESYPRKGGMRIPGILPQRLLLSRLPKSSLRSLQNTESPFHDNSASLSRDAGNFAFSCSNSSLTEEGIPFLYVLVLFPDFGDLFQEKALSKKLKSARPCNTKALRFL